MFRQRCMSRKFRQTGKRPCLVEGCRGFSYLEVMLAVVLVAVCLVPLLEAVSSSLSLLEGGEDHLVDHLSLQAKMETVLKEPFGDLAAAGLAAGSLSVATSYSDVAPFMTADNRLITRQVYIALYDGDGDSTPDSDLLLVRTSIEGTAYRLETLVSK